MTTGVYSKKRDKLKEVKVLYELYRKFELQWFPNKEIASTIDFLLWLDRMGYEIVESKK